MADFQPFESMRFRVKWDGKFIAGVSKVSGLRWSAEVVVHRDGGETSAERKIPGRQIYEPLALERGLTADFAFEAWAAELRGVVAVPSGGVRKDIEIELFDEAARVVAAYLVSGCWPSGYEAFSTLDADGDLIAVERLILQYELWVRDSSVVAPAAGD